MNGFENRFLAWLRQLDEWCSKHKITRMQAVSILFDDGPYNPNGTDFVVSKDLFWAEDQEFVDELKKRKYINEQPCGDNNETNRETAETNNNTLD